MPIKTANIVMLKKNDTKWDRRIIQFPVRKDVQNVFEFSGVLQRAIVFVKSLYRDRK